MTKKTRFILFMLLMNRIGSWAQGVSHLVEGLDINTEVQYTTSDNLTPLWLNANRYGLSSLKGSNGYMRLAAQRGLQADSAKNWRVGYGLDVAVASHFQNTFILQQAYAELAYKKFTLSLGAKQYPVENKNAELSSGSMAISNNARPIPQLRLDVDYFTVPYTKGVMQMKAYGSYGFTTDGNWQKNIVAEGERYTGNVLYHEKEVFMKFGKEHSKTLPLTFELGIKVASFFGGTTYNYLGRGFDGKLDIPHPEDFSSFMEVMFFLGIDETDGTSKNTRGNHVGAWDMRLKWHGEGWSAAARFERVFEDQSMMFVQYGIYDHMLGLDLELPKNPYLSAFTVEHISTIDQSGAILHDRAEIIPDKMNGRDNYYNHSLYSGYQHWGQTLGNPLLTSPIYRPDSGNIYFFNNRIQAWHLGFSGDPASWLHWRLLASFTENRGTYDKPFDERQRQNYFLLETTVKPHALKGWHARLGLGVDHGSVTGNNLGASLTIGHTLSVN